MAGAAIIALAGFAGTAQAQDQAITPIADDQPQDEFDDENVVIVTGQKITRSLQDTAASVKVFDEETIDEQNFIDLADLLNQTANVNTGFGEEVITIRGIRNAGAGLGETTSDTSTVYIDGVFIPSALFTAGGALNLFDVSSVEIFRGPQSTIQGRNALAGAIVINTIDPGNDFSGQGQISYAEFDTFRGSAALTVPVVQDLLSLRVSGDYTSSDGFIFNPTLNTDESDAQEAATIRAKARLTPAEGFEFIASYTYIDANQGEGRIDDTFFPPDRLNFENIQSLTETRADIFSFEANIDIADGLSLTAVTGYIESSNITFLDTSRDETGGDITVGNNSTNDEVFSQELRLSYVSPDDRLTGLLGFYYFDSSSAFENTSSAVVDTDLALPDAGTIASLLFQTPAPNPIQIGQGQFVRDTAVASVPSFQVDFAADNPTDIENFAFFGEVNYKLTDRLSITVGARYDDESITQSVLNFTGVPPIGETGVPIVDGALQLLASQFTSAVTINNAQNNFSAFLPKGVITYDWSDDVSTSFSVQRAYRAGGVSVNAFRGALPIPGGGDATDQEVLEANAIINTFDPEFSTNYEFSFRSQFADRKVTLNANVFFIDYSDQQVTVQLSANPLDNLTDNAGASELFGFEVEMFAQPTDELTFNVGVGFTDTQFTEAQSDLGPVSIDFTGNQFTFAPRWTINGGARYTHDSGFFANGRFRFTDESFALIGNEPDAVNDSNMVVDLIVGYQTDDFRVELFGTNVLNEEFLTFNSVDTVVGAVNIAGPPQVFGVRLVGGF